MIFTLYESSCVKPAKNKMSFIDHLQEGNQSISAAAEAQQKKKKKSINKTSNATCIRKLRHYKC